MSTQATIVASRREAGDSMDFHARHGRALHARAVREGMEALLTLYRSWRRGGTPAGRGWQVEWPTGSRTSHLTQL